MATREEDFVKKIFTASTHDTILFFSNKGKVYTLKGYELPEAGRTAKGTAIVNLLRLDQGEKITAVIPIANFAEGKYLLMGTKKGLIKKVDIKQCIKSYRFADESLFIVLKTGQNLEGGIPSLRADTLMELISPDVKFDITRTRFFDEKELEV